MMGHADGERGCRLVVSARQEARIVREGGESLCAGAVGREASTRGRPLSARSSVGPMAEKRGKRRPRKRRAGARIERLWQKTQEQVKDGVQERGRTQRAEILEKEKEARGWAEASAGRQATRAR
eukprot:1469931-Pleurochrysis_carterae.AAC.1